MLPRRYLDEICYIYTSYRSWKRITSPTVREAESPPLPKQEARDNVYTFMHPEEYTLTESIGDSSTSSAGEELDDSEDEDECQ